MMMTNTKNANVDSSEYKKLIDTSTKLDKKMPKVLQWLRNKIESEKKRQVQVTRIVQSIGKQVETKQKKCAKAHLALCNMYVHYMTKMYTISVIAAYTTANVARSKREQKTDANKHYTQKDNATTDTLATLQYNKKTMCDDMKVTKYNTECNRNASCKHNNTTTDTQDKDKRIRPKIVTFGTVTIKYIQ